MSPTLIAHNSKCAPILVGSTNTKASIEVDLSPTLHVRGGAPLMAKGYVVRRLTPMECERLQGFPDGWTDIGEWTDSKGKKRKATDGNRYKALGNSFAVPVVRWLGERIQLLEDECTSRTTERPERTRE